MDHEGLSAARVDAEATQYGGRVPWVRAQRLNCAWTMQPPKRAHSGSGAYPCQSKMPPERCFLSGGCTTDPASEMWPRS